MNKFELRDVGDGHFELSGDMSFATAADILRASERSFGEFRNLEVDLSKVRKADSAGLALLLEWKARAHQNATEIEYVGIPDSLLAIASTTEVSDLI
ncbi:MAG: STAS domain-containing protein [Gammaproteobacteria bacterium]|nr:STAS domain-containing protein [Gammaproteobacteria bacterium]